MNPFYLIKVLFVYLKNLFYLFVFSVFWARIGLFLTDIFSSFLLNI